MDAAKRQAERYGRQAALLREAGFERDFYAVKIAWVQFFNQFNPATFRAMELVDAYYDADYEVYCEIEKTARTYLRQSYSGV